MGVSQKASASDKVREDVVCNNGDPLVKGIWVSASNPGGMLHPDHCYARASLGRMLGMIYEFPGRWYQDNVPILRARKMPTVAGLSVRHSMPPTCLECRTRMKADKSGVTSRMQIPRLKPISGSRRAQAINHTRSVIDKLWSDVPGWL